MLAQDKPLQGKKIGLFGKGGSGKSTIAVLLARALSRKYTVCLLDADSSNVGMHRALGLDSSPEMLLDYFGGMVFSGGRVTCPVDDPAALEGATFALEELPGPYFARSEEGVILLTAGKIAELGPGAGCDGPIAKIARDLQLRSPGDEAPVLLVDSKAGIEDTARGVVTGLDWIVAVVDPTTAAMEMVCHLRRMLIQLQLGASPATEHLTDPALAMLARRFYREARVKGLLAVLNRVADDEMEAHLRNRLVKNGVTPVAAVREHKGILMAWMRGERLPADFGADEANAVMRELEAAERALVFSASRRKSV